MRFRSLLLALLIGAGLLAPALVPLQAKTHYYKPRKLKKYKGSKKFKKHKVGHKARKVQHR